MTDPSKPKTRIIKKRDPETGEVITVEVPIEPQSSTTWTPPAATTPQPASPPMNRKLLAAIVGTGAIVIGVVLALPTLQEMQYWGRVDCAVTESVNAYQNTYSNGRYQTEATACLTEIAEAKVKANEKDSNGNAPLYNAVTNGDASKVRQLISDGADVNAIWVNGLTPLHWAVNNNLEMANLLIANGADVNFKVVWGFTPLHMVVSSENLESAKLLIANGADVNAQDELGSTPLHSAATWRNLELVNLLIANGADVNAQDLSGYSPDLNF